MNIVDMSKFIIILFVIFCLASCDASYGKNAAYERCMEHAVAEENNANRRMRRIIELCEAGDCEISEDRIRELANAEIRDCLKWTEELYGQD